MGLETGVTYIEDLVATNPVGATDNVDEGDDHIRNIKTAVKGSLPNLGNAAVTCTAEELNYNDITTLGTAQASKTLTADSGKALTGMTSITSTDFVGDLTGNATTATTAVNVSGTGVIDNANMADNSIGADELILGAVGDEIALMAAAAIGSYAMLYNLTGITQSQDDVALGSNLRFSSSAPDVGAAPAGNWRCMGYSTALTATLWLRIS